MTAEGAILVFAGPSLPPELRPVHPSLRWRGPAAAGDGLDALEAPGLRSFLLIDGLFDETPAIRHKELLLLLSRGVRVLGAASMGALRAAELHVHGMVGVGEVFRAYARGCLTGDDEVALLHGPELTGWNAVTEPLVNVRATVLRAVREQVITGALARGVIEAAGRQHFSGRTWETVLEAAAGSGRDGLDRFAAWLPSNRIDLKRRDALACVRLALSTASEPPVRQPPPPATRFTAELASARRAQASA